jgi:CelD/BcsL family acetyltransferase involved in cellulose biosynthesis
VSQAVAEFVDFDALETIAPEWADLCARAEPNPFAEPGFLLPLLAYERPRGLRFVLVRESGRLIGFAALILPRVGLARVWMSAYAALPALAFDGDAAPAALAKLIGARTRLAGIVWPFVERDSALHAALAAAGLPLSFAGGARRVALRLAGVAAFEASLDPKRRTKWARQARKLATRGKLETTSDGVEAFFEVERKGWKGARGTALADDPARLAFARAALSAFADAGRLDALALTLDGAPIAAGLVLIAGERAFYWKTAYDEAFAEASPGVQLTLAHSRRLAQTPGLSLVDSCAIEDHPMIGRVWGDALEFEDLAMALRSEQALRIWLALAQMRGQGREALKRWVKKALGRKRS